ncbi:MAG: O-antigen ligase family protein [Oscillospiraceae bacterium]
MPKTIFGTTEKSNFILNMKDDTIEKLPVICAKLIAILFVIGQAVPELIEIFSKLLGFGMGKAYGFLNTPFICLAVVWVTSIIMLVIMVSRQRFVKSVHTVPIVILSAFCLWSLLSTIQSISPIDSINGMYGRTTGILTVISCATIMLLMTFINKEVNLRSIIKILVTSSAVQCCWGFLQVISYLFTFEMSYYENLNCISLYKVCLPSGFSGSPIFFAEYLGLMLGITLILSCLEKDRFYMVMSAIYTYLMLDTHTVVGFIGFIIIVISTSMILIFKKDKNFIPVILCVIVGLITYIVSVILDGHYIFYDGAIMFQDSFYRLGITNTYWLPSADFNVNNVSEVFQYVWKIAIFYLKYFLLFGVGLDCFIYTQLGDFESTGYIQNGFDLVYNDYLQIVISMGVPALIIYLIGVIFCFIKVIKRFNDSNIFKGLLISMIAFVTMSFVSCTTIHIMPYVSIILGLACCKKFEDVQK